MKIGNYLELELEGGLKVPVKFGTGAIDIFCEIYDCDIDFFDTLFAEKSTLKTIEKLKAYRTALYAAAAYAAKSTGKPVDFNEYTVADWIDQNGGYQGEILQQVVKGLASSLYGVSVQELEKAGEEQGPQSPSPEQA